MTQKSASSTFDVMAESAEQAVPCADLPLEQRIEALLMVADRPMTDARIAEVLSVQDPKDTKVREAVDALNARYAADGRTFRIERLAGGNQVMTLPAFGPVVARLRGVREQGRLTQAALETLAIIAYRQPILRADLESIRGVACGEVLRSLMDRRLVKIVGRADEVGRPMLYGTTSEFLRQFGIGKLDELPNAKDLR
ncbi:MAG: SMC-Scp complex subunit ScpB [Phycisphaerales bacterium]|nr:SMC-Scp complex subunit ScpB [Phycisphaerales bacterium]